MFAINATYDIKLVSHNQQRLVYYSSKQAYGSDFSCDSDRDCSVHFVDAKQIGAGLQLPEPPLEFGCNKQLHRCHGLDWRLNLYAIAHVLWKPLFGLGGHPLAGGVVSDFFRPKIQQIVDAASAHDPADRPPIDDLRNALFSLVRGQVAPYCVPQNIGVTSFSTQRDKADKMLHGAPNKDAPRWDVPETIELPKLSHGEKPITLTNWFFKFQPTPQMPMTVRLLGVYNEQPWGSSPIYVRQNATLLRTRSGKAYMLRGAVNCEGLKTEGFTDEFCHKFHYGFPSRWKENLSDAWDKLQNTLRKQFFAKHAPKTPLKYDAAEWIDRSELSVSGAGAGVGGAGSASEDFVVALSSEQSEGSAFSIRTKAKSGGVAHAVWLSASATDTTTTADTDGDQVSGGDDDATETSAIIQNHDVVSEKPGDAAAVKQLLADERAEKSRLAALASKSPCGAEGLEAEGVCCLLTCGTVRRRALRDAHRRSRRLLSRPDSPLRPAVPRQSAALYIATDRRVKDGQPAAARVGAARRVLVGAERSGRDAVRHRRVARAARVGVDWRQALHCAARDGARRPVSALDRGARRPPAESGPHHGRHCRHCGAGAARAGDWHRQRHVELVSAANHRAALQRRHQARRGRQEPGQHAARQNGVSRRRRGHDV
jgi:hypothetical protein